MPTIPDLRAALRPLWPLVLCGMAACDSSGGGSANSVTIRYDGDTRAYGISIRTGTAATSASRSGARDGSPVCTMTAAATASGCSASIDASADGLDLALHGCFVEAGAALFDCQLSSAQAGGLRTGATVHAGCGCQVFCPTDPAIVVCDDGDVECEGAALADAATAQRTRPDVVATTQRGTGETTCSTCCETDYFPDEIGSVVSEEPLSEIQVDIDFAEECRFDFNGKAECEVYDPAENWVRVRSSGGTISQRWCFAASGEELEAGSLPILSCRGSIDRITVTRATGRDFGPLSVLPTVEFE